MDQLNPTDRALLESVLMKSPSELTADDIAVLNARRGYLTYAQRQAYKGIIINDIDGEEPVAPQTNEPTKYTDPEATQPEVTPAEQSQPEQPQTPETTQDDNPYSANLDDLA